MRYVMIVAVSLLASGCWAQVEQPEVCLTLTDQEVPGSVLGTGEIALPYDLEPALPDDQEVEDLEVRLLSVSLTSEQDLTAIETVSVRAKGAGEIASFERQGDEPVRAVPSGDADLAGLLDGRKVHLTAVVSGALPAEAWKTDVEACFEVRARTQWFP